MSAASASSAPFAPISPDWRQWVAENALRDCTPQSMCETMINAGVPREAAVAGVASVLDDPCYRAALKHRQLARKQQSILLNQHRLLQHAPGWGHIEKRSGLSHRELLERYAMGSYPVVVKDLAQGWPALQRWTPAYLQERFGALEIEVQAGRSAEKDYEPNKLALRRRMRLADFIDRIQAGPSNDLYLTANNEALRDTALAALLEDIGPLPEYLEPATLGGSAFLWVGPAGTVTPLHHDTVHLFHLQIFGRKRWRFISPLQTPLVYNFNAVFSEVNLDAPDLGRYPEFAKAQVLDVVVEPGEAIFLPLAWWHHVSSLDTCISLSLSNVRLPNHFEYDNPAITNW